MDSSKNYTEVVVFHNEFYERYYGDFSPVGNLSASIQRCYRGYYNDWKAYKTSDYTENTNVRIYSSDVNNIFIFVGEDKFDEGHIYHKISDSFPDYTDKSLVSGIQVWHYGTNKIINLSPKAENEVLEFISKMKKGLITDTQKATTGFAEAGLIIHFKNYPATDNSILLMEPKYLKDGKAALYFGSSDENKKLLGMGNVAIIPNELFLELK